MDYSSWQWVFYINLPIGILAAITIFIGLNGESVLADKIIIDYAGIITLIIGTVGLLLGLNLGGTDYPWFSWQILGLLGASLVSWLIFINAEKKAVDPVLSLDLFKNRVFAVTNIVGFLMGLGMFGSLMFLPLFFQGVLGISATNSGNTMLPMMFAMMTTSIVAGRFSAKVQFRSMYILGLSLMALSFYLMSTMTVNTTQFTSIIYIIILGIGMGIIMPIITIAVQSAFGPEKRGVATSATQFFPSIGGTVGMTVLGIIFNNYSKNIMRKDFLSIIQNVPGLTHGPLTMMLDKADENPHSLFNILLSPNMIQGIPVELQTLVLPPLKAVLAESLHVVFGVSMLTVSVGIIVSIFVGNATLKKKQKRKPIEEAGLTLFAEGIPEVELAAELIPDLIDGTRPNITIRTFAK